MPKKEIKLSATRISSFLECKQKYWFNYEEHLPKVESPAFRLGLAAHESLELAGNIWMKKEDPHKFTKAEEKKILDKYREIAAKEGIQDMAIYKEGIKLVKNRLADFNLGKIMGLEIKFGFRGGENITTKDGVPLVGAIDKVVEIDDETLLVVDYKTSKTVPTADQLKDDIQLSIYDLVASKKWPEYKRIILSLDMLKSDIVYSYRTAEEREEFETYLKVLYDSMVNLKKKDARPQLNTFCPWCDYKEYCPAYGKACKKSDNKFLSTLSLSDEELIKEWQEVRSTKKILEERDRELSMILEEKIKRFDTQPEFGDQEVYIRQNSRKNYPVDIVSKYVPKDDLLKMVSLNKKAVEEYANKNPAVRDFILNSAEMNFTKPFLATRKIRKGKGE